MLLLATAAALALQPAYGAGQPPAPAPPTVIDGPNSSIIRLSGMSVARDGTGGIVYMRNVAGTQHVFVARLAGTFKAPERIDVGLSGPSSQPVIAAGRGGLLLIGFINGGQLYVVDRASTEIPYGAPAPLSAAASNPSIAITNLSKAYLAFTAGGAGGHNVRCAYYENGSWSLASAPLDAAVGNDAGSGSGRPAVTASGDGVGIVAWGEAGHIFTRRIWRSSPSIVHEQADVGSLSGWNEVASSDPVIGTGGDSSYAAVGFRETVTNGAAQQSRVLARRLHGSLFEGVSQADALSTPAAEGADQPAVAVGEYGQGFLTSERTSSHQLFAMRLASNEAADGVTRIDSLPNAAPAFAVPASAGYHDSLIAWQRQNPLGGGTDIHASFYDGSSFWPEQVLSSPARGPADAADGLAAAGDVAADAVVAWVQGGAGSRAIVVAQMYQPPGSFGALSRFAYARSTNPVLSWSPSREYWGPLQYIVRIGGSQVGRTSGTSLRVPASLGQGSHNWQVTAINPAGGKRTDATAKVFIDTIAPKARVRLSGKRLVGSSLHLYVRYTDSSPRPADASGVKEVRVGWGDGQISRIGHNGYHAFRAARVYRITVTVRDRAGNQRKLKLKVRVAGAGAGVRKSSHGHH